MFWQDDVELLQVWSSYSVLNVLYSLIQKSKINENILAQQEGKSSAEIAYVPGLRCSLAIVLTYSQ